jgi:hypothetical protein
MPVPLRYVTCHDFPEVGLGESISTAVHLSLPWGDTTAETSLTYLGRADDQDFERYEVLHQVERDVDAFYNQQLVKRILENRRFFAFYNRANHYFLFGARRKDALGVFERLARIDPPIHAQSDDIDLRKVLVLGKTTGGYFGKLQIAKVRTAAVFGSTTVVESEEWDHYAGLGELTVVYMQVMADDGETRTLMLMPDRSVLLMKDGGDGANLRFVADMQVDIEKLLDQNP